MSRQSRAKVGVGDCEWVTVGEDYAKVVGLVRLFRVVTRVSDNHDLDAMWNIDAEDIVQNPHVKKLRNP